MLLLVVSGGCSKAPAVGEQCQPGEWGAVLKGHRRDVHRSWEALATWGTVRSSFLRGQSPAQVSGLLHGAVPFRKGMKDPLPWSLHCSPVSLRPRIQSNLGQWDARPNGLEDGVGWGWAWCVWQRSSSVLRNTKKRLSLLPLDIDLGI